MDTETQEAVTVEDAATEAPSEQPEAEAVDSEDLSSLFDELEEGETKEPEPWEFNFGSEKFTVSKEQMPDDVAENLSKFSKGIWADYTRKTQELARGRKDLEASQGALQKLMGLQGEALETYSKGLAVSNEIQRLREVNLEPLWNSQNQEEVDYARRVSDQLLRKQAEFESIKAELSEKDGNLTKAQAEERSRLVNEGKEVIRKKIPGFKEAEVIDYVSGSYDVSREVAERDWAINPMVTELAWKAMQYDRLKAKASKRPKETASAPVTPMRGRGGGDTSAMPSDKDDMKAWLRKRNKQLRARSGR